MGTANYLVKESRQRASLSQTELARRAGTTQSVIARTEGATTSPSFDRMVSLIRACGYDVQIRIVPLDETDWNQARQNLKLSTNERVQKLINFVNFSLAGRSAISKNG